MELLERGLLKLFNPFRIAVGRLAAERLQLRDHVVQVRRVDAGVLEIPAQRLGVALPLAELAGELARIERLAA